MTEDELLAAWQTSIPAQYAFTGKTRHASASISDRHLSPALITAVPAAAKLERWLAKQHEPHLTRAQITSRAKLDKRGRKAQG